MATARIAEPRGADAAVRVLRRLAQKSTADANDVIYQYEASRGYNPAPKLESIKARLLAINSADDERNPPELGILEREIKRIKHGRYVLIPASEETRGHGTTGMAKLWKHHLSEFLQPSAQAAK
jgi:homoserine O-acetyltransferase/O-succinyltransferase